MEKEIHKKSSSSQSGKASDFLFRGIMYLLYGKKAGETMVEKTPRLGVIILILVALIAIFIKLLN